MDRRLTPVPGGAAVPEGAWRFRKARSLVKLLALVPAQALPREEVMEALWPELDLAAAASNLRVALHAARRALLPHGAIDSLDGTLALGAAGGTPSPDEAITLADAPRSDR